MLDREVLFLMPVLMLLLVVCLSQTDLNVSVEREGGSGGSLSLIGSKYLRATSNELQLVSGK